MLLICFRAFLLLLFNKRLMVWFMLLDHGIPFPSHNHLQGGKTNHRRKLTSIEKTTSTACTYLEFQICETLGLSSEFITHNSYTFNSSTGLKVSKQFFWSRWIIYLTNIYWVPRIQKYYICGKEWARKLDTFRNKYSTIHHHSCCLHS